eukprot:7577686-Karenia_brevis.AAC.1
MTFQKLFEIFCLKEDRRHERDHRMREIKEYFAWGGTDIAAVKASMLDRLDQHKDTEHSRQDVLSHCQEAWPIHTD